MTKYFQEGGAIGANQLMQEMFMSYLADKYQTDDINTLVEKLQSTPGESGETKLEDEMIEFQQLLQQQQQGGTPQMAKNGSKLNYIKSLRGTCPEGTEISYYKNGNKICSKCVAKQNEKEQIVNKTEFFKKGGETPADIQAASCGAKAKKACNGKKITKKCKFGGTLYFK